jgi:hypothetical protein
VPKVLAELPAGPKEEARLSERTVRASALSGGACAGNQNRADAANAGDLR